MSPEKYNFLTRYGKKQCDPYTGKGRQVKLPVRGPDACEGQD